MQIELSPEARLEIASLVYNKWAESYDAFKAAQTATWEANKWLCPKEDWPLFRAHQMEYAEKALDKWTKLKEEVCKYSPLVTGE